MNQDKMDQGKNQDHKNGAHSKPDTSTAGGKSGSAGNGAGSPGKDANKTDRPDNANRSQAGKPQESNKNQS